MWWFDREQLCGDLIWVLVGTVGLFLVTVISVLVPAVLFSELVPSGGGVPTSANTIADTSISAVTLVLELFFGFALAAFQKETPLHGFLQRILEERCNATVAIVGQAVIFMLAHFGYYPVAAWPLPLIGQFCRIRNVTPSRSGRRSLPRVVR